MNYRDFFKNKKATRKDILALIPEGVDPKEFEMGVGDEQEHTDNEFLAAKIAGDHLKGDRHYYSKLKNAGLEEDGMEECDTCGCGDPNDDHSHEDGYEENGGLPKLGGALAVPHRGQPIMMGKIIQVGSLGGGPASGELSGMTAAGVKDKGVPATQPGDKEPITAGGKAVGSSIASKSVGGSVVPGEGQQQGGPDMKGTIAGTSKLTESKSKVRRIVKEVLKEITFDRQSGQWVRLNEGGHKAGCGCGFCKNKGTFGKKKDDKKDKNGGEKEDKKKSNKNPFAKKKDEVDETVNMKMGKSYKTVQPRMYDIQSDDRARTNQYDPEITEMYDDEEECMMNERYVELANAGRNLSEAELSELKTLSEKIEKVNDIRKNYGASQGGVEPNVYENQVNMKMGPSYKTVQPRQYKVASDDDARTNQYDPQVSEETESPQTLNTSPDVNRNRDDVELGHPGQTGGFHTWHCHKCGHEITSKGGNAPQSIRWTDGHTCHFTSKKDVDVGGVSEGRCEDFPCCGHESGDCPDRDEDGNESWKCAKCRATLPKGARSSLCSGCMDRLNRLQDEDPTGQDAEDMFEAGAGAVQHSSYRNVGHGNLPQSGKQRWANDMDESKKVSKVTKTISKGQKPNKTKKNPLLKFQKAKKTTSGVHKRKT